MSESSINIVIYTSSHEKTQKLIKGFRLAHTLEEKSEENLCKVFNEYIGEEFTKIITKELKGLSDVKKYEKFLSKGSLDMMDYFMTMQKINTVNEDRIWQDSDSGDMSIYEVCPEELTLKLKTKVDKHTVDHIDLYYDSGANYELKAAVFATAFEAAGFRIDRVASSDEYEDDEEY